MSMSYRNIVVMLLATACGGHPLQALLRGFGRNGLDAQATSRLLTLRHTFKSGVLVHVRLQNVLQALANSRTVDTNDTLHESAAAKLPASAVLRLLKGLRRILLAMPTPKPTVWTGYPANSTYTLELIQYKQAVVEKWCRERIKPIDVDLDVGCNTGSYSGVLAKYARQVIPIDADMPCIDEFYRCRENNVLSLVVDFTDPTPPGGWAQAEGQAFSERIRPDWSIWLAVIHHLAIDNGIKLDAVVQQIAASAEKMIVKFVAPEDDMVRAF